MSDDDRRREDKILLDTYREENKKLWDAIAHDRVALKNSLDVFNRAIDLLRDCELWLDRNLGELEDSDGGNALAASIDEFLAPYRRL